MIEEEVGITNGMRGGDGDDRYAKDDIGELLEQLDPCLMDGGASVDSVIDEEDERRVRRV